MKHPWTNVYGAARSLLAFGLLSTLLVDRIDVFFQPAGFQSLQGGSAVHQIGLFYLLAGSRIGLEVARWIAIAVLLAVVIGWRPRITGVLHWWVAFSFAGPAIVAEGGDQVHAILALLLVPVTLVDPRRWHWSAWTPDAARTASHVRAVVAASCFTMIRLQVAAIYFHAGVSKMFAPEWPNGTAIYYWFTHPTFGMSEPLRSLTMPLLSTSVGVTAITWGVMLFEILLASALVMDRRHFAPLLKVGLLFHFGIVLAHGLFSFFFAMAGALVLYLRPWDEPFPRLPVLNPRLLVQRLLAGWRSRAEAGRSPSAA